MSHLRLPIAISTGIAAAALLVGCSSSSGKSGAPSDTGNGATSASAPAAVSGGGSSAAPAPATGKTITAKLTEFHIALSSTHLSPGTYSIKVTNAGHITHALVVDGKGVDDKATSDLDPGKSANLSVTLSAGKYEVFCPVGNHKMEGMDTSVQVSG